MAVTKVLARDWKLEIKSGGTEAEPIWTEIKGLNSLSFSSEKNDADTTSFDEGGRTTHLVASRGASLTAEGLYLLDVTDGTRDAGQQAVEDLADKIGPESIGDFKLTDPAGNNRKFRASANLSDTGGGTDDPTSWGAELTVSGAITFTSVVETP